MDLKTINMATQTLTSLLKETSERKKKANAFGKIAFSKLLVSKPIVTERNRLLGTATSVQQDDQIFAS